MRTRLQPILESETANWLWIDKTQTWAPCRFCGSSGNLLLWGRSQDLDKGYVNSRPVCQACADEIESEVLGPRRALKALAK